MSNIEFDSMLIHSTQTLFLMMLKRLRFDKSIIRDPVSIQSQLFSTSSPLRYVAGKALQASFKAIWALRGWRTFFFDGDGESTNMICLWHDDPYGGWATDKLCRVMLECLPWTWANEGENKKRTTTTSTVPFVKTNKY